jgi:hypothetical protein
MRHLSSKPQTSSLTSDLSLLVKLMFVLHRTVLSVAINGCKVTLQIILCITYDKEWFFILGKVQFTIQFLLYGNRGFKSQHYGVLCYILTLGRGLMVAVCDTWPAGPHASHDTPSVKVMKHKTAYFISVCTVIYMYQFLIHFLSHGDMKSARCYWIEQQFPTFSPPRTPFLTKMVGFMFYVK